MGNNVLSKKVKALIALATIGTVIFTTAAPAVSAAMNTDSTKAMEQKSNTKRSIGYYADWSIWGGEDNMYPERVPAEYLTHLNVAFTDVNKDGTLRMIDKDANFGHPLGHEGITWGDINGGIVNDLQVVRQKNPNLKLGFSVGGWSLSGHFTHVARNEATRKTFAKEVAQLLKNTNFDFIDIDWEYPAAVRDADNVDLTHDQGNPDAIPEDKQNYVLMLKEIRKELDALSTETGKKYEISIAINMSHEKTEIGIDVPEIFKVIDFANVMTYDANGAWSNVSGHQTALYDNPHDPWAGKGFTVDSSIKNFLKLGAPAEKLVVGAAFYTRGWEKVNNDGPIPELPGLYGTAEKVNKDADLSLSYGAKNFAPIKVGDGGRNAGSWPWRARAELHTAYPGLVEYWDDTAKAPYLYNKDTGAMFTYDNKRSIQEKTKYVNENNLGGIITWMASNDLKTESGKNDDLTKVIKEGLFGSADLPKHEIVEPKTDVSAKVTQSSNSWESTGLLNIQLTNNGKLDGTGSPMVKISEEAMDTVKNPKLYIKTNGIAITQALSPAPNVTKEGDYYVVDFSASYDLKLMKPGQSTSFQLKLDKMLDDKLTGIEEIYITQRMYKGAPEFGKKVLYTGAEVSYDAEDVNKDGVVDVKDLTEVASRYNKRTGETGYDVKYDIVKDNIIDLFDLTKVSKKLGSTDGGGGEVDPPTPGENEWSPDKVYKGGDVVTYKTKKYRAKWETKGEEPGQPWNAWEEIK